MKQQHLIMGQESRNKHWSSKMLNLLGIWLWEQGEYGHSLLCITGSQWGYKVGSQLKVTWDSVIHTDDHEVKIELEHPDEDNRPLNGFAKKYIELAVNTVDIDDYEETIFMNYKTGKPLSTSTLNRELQRFSEKFFASIQGKLYTEVNLKPLKSNAFQIAFALEMLKKYNYSKKCFVEISKFMGHRTLKDTIKLLEVEPFDEIIYDFNGIDENESFDSMLFENDQKLNSYIHEATFDYWLSSKESILTH